MTDIERCLEIDRELRPDLYDKIDSIARIIDAGSFSKCSGFPEESVDRINLRYKYQRTSARVKATEILRLLGEDVPPADWMTILEKLKVKQ